MQPVQKFLGYLRDLFLLPVQVRRSMQRLQEVSDQLRRQSLILAQLSDRVQKQPPQIESSCVLMTVLIIRENAAFLDEWIGHHLELGIEHVVLYDNSESKRDDAVGCDVHGGDSNHSSLNKHGVNYAEMLGERGTQEFAFTEIQRIVAKYEGKVTIRKWSRKNDAGTVCHFQKEAIADLALNFRHLFRYCLHIDCDEFLISDRGWSVRDLIASMEERGISSGLIGQRRFLYRFASLDSSVREIPWCLRRDADSADYGSGKTLFRLDLFSGFSDWYHVHAVPSLCGFGRIRWQDMRFHHYGWPGFRQRRSLSELDAREQQFLFDEFAKDETMYRYLSSKDTNDFSGVPQQP
jgi:hypothetical protein